MSETVTAREWQSIRRGRVVETCFGAACSYAKNGEHEAALEALEECFRADDRDVERWRVDPDLASLRDDSRFQQLLQGMEARARRLARRI